MLAKRHTEGEHQAVPTAQRSGGVAAQHDEEESAGGVGAPRGLCGRVLTACLCCCAIQRWKYPTPAEARLVSWVSIMVTCATALAGILLATLGESASMLAFGLEALIDIFSSVVILWRFREDHPTRGLERREDRASVLIGCSFVVLGVFVFGTAVSNLAAHERVTDQAAMLGITIPSAFILLVLGSLKMHVASALRSGALWEDGVCSLGSCVLSLSVVGSIFLARANPDLWWVDSLVALVVAVLLFCYGTIIVRRKPWTSRAFWTVEDPEEEDGDEDGADGAGRRDSYDNGIDLKPLDMDMI